MARLRGTGMGAGMAMGTAAVIRLQSGAVLMPEMPARVASLLAMRRLTETPEVVLVAADLLTAQAIAASLSWARVVGIAAEHDLSSAVTPSIPTVIGVAGLMSAADDDVLILVDATRGVVLVEPDPIYLAQYTSEHDRVAPRNRIYLDEAHLPAQTLDGRAISVTAFAAEGELEIALAAGPDAVYHPLPLVFDPDDLRRHLSRTLATLAGKPLIVPYNQSVPLSPLVEAASMADITLCVADPEGGTAPNAALLQALGEDIAAAQAECGERDRLFGTPRIATMVNASRIWPPEESAALVDQLAACGVTRIVVSFAEGPATLEGLAEFTAAASISLLPVMCWLEEGLALAAPAIGVPASPPDGAPEDSLPPADAELAARTGPGAITDPAAVAQLLVGAGITGFIVGRSDIGRIKAAINADTFAGSREHLAQWLEAR